MKSEAMLGTIFDGLVVLDHSESPCPNSEDVPEINLTPANPESVVRFWLGGMPSGYDWIPDKNQGDNN